MKVINYSLPRSDLASRKLAIIERNKIESYISTKDVLIKLDMANISSISESYSDELFGVLVLRYGIDTVLNAINVNNAKKHVLLSIAQVMNRRSQELAVAV
tara:strand:- start:350 stop:652 length:303 start_codon:yes stop_codon:yes gene_type:complete